jgi:hypothetical protein
VRPARGRSNAGSSVSTVFEAAFRFCDRSFFYKSGGNLKVAVTMKTMKTALLLSGVMAASLVLGACRDEEQGRSLAYDKGNYAGKPDTKLSNATRRALMERIHHQGGLDTASGGASGTSGAAPGTDVRPPEPRK